MPTWLSNGPAPAAVTTRVRCEQAATGDSTLSAIETVHTPACAAVRGGIDQPTVVASKIDRDEDVVLLHQGHRTANSDVVAVDHRHIRPQRIEIADELRGDALRGVTRHHEDAAVRVGEMIDDIRQRDLIELTQCGLHIAQFELQMAVQRVVNRWIADPLGRRAQLIGQILLH